MCTHREGGQVLDRDGARVQAGKRATRLEGPQQIARDREKTMPDLRNASHAKRRVCVCVLF